MSERILDSERVSLTAWTIANRRTFTDIPYSSEIFKHLEEQYELQNIHIPEALKSPEITPQIEARYKLINKLIKKTDNSQVLELAAGFSPRGLELTDDKSVTYVETDLTKVVAQKSRIVDLIGQRDNLHVVGADALDFESLESTLRFFNENQALTIVNEGLLRYFTFDQKEIIAKNIHKLLVKFGGVWITSDISLKSILKSEDNVRKKSSFEVGQVIGVDVNQNCFDNVGHAQSFFENLGFSVEKHSFMEVVGDLSSPKILGQTEDQVKNLLRDPCVFVMRVT